MWSRSVICSAISIADSDSKHSAFGHSAWKRKTHTSQGNEKLRQKKSFAFPHVQVYFDHSGEKLYLLDLAEFTFHQMDV